VRLYQRLGVFHRLVGVKAIVKPDELDLLAPNAAAFVEVVEVRAHAAYIVGRQGCGGAG